MIYASLKAFFLLLTLAAFAIYVAVALAETNGGVWVRYNKAGYPSGGSKRIVVVANRSLNGTNWNVADTNLRGTLNGERSSTGNYLPGNFKYYDLPLDRLECNQNTACDYKVQIGSVSTVSVKIYPKGKYPFDVLINEILDHFKIHRSGVNLTNEKNWNGTAIGLNVGHSQDTNLRIFQTNRSGDINYNSSDWVATNRSGDFSGGWYDAGDYIKFTHTIAFSTYALLRAFQTTSENKSYRNRIREEAVIGLNYLAKLTPADNIFIVQVADKSDHLPQTERLLPHLDQRPRRAYAADSSPQMYNAAAALALGSRLLGKPEWLETAQKIYRRADAADKYVSLNEHYQDTKFEDNKRLAATELYRSGKLEFKNDAHLNEPVSDTVDYQTSEILALLNPETAVADAPQILDVIRDDYLSHIEGDDAKDNVWRIPASSEYQRLYNMFGPAFIAARNRETNPNKLARHRRVAFDTLNYLFGLNNWNVSLMRTSLCQKCNDERGGFISYDAIYRYMKTNNRPLDLRGGGEIYQAGLPPSELDTDEAADCQTWEREFDTPEVLFCYHQENHQTIETSIWGESLAVAFLAATAELDR